MNTTSCKAGIALMASLLAMTLSDVAGAHITYGGGCTGCHHSSGSGSLSASPNPLDLKQGNSGLLTFLITSLGSASDSAISVQGLENPALDASIVPGGNAWTHRSDSHGTSYVSNDITSTGSYTLNLGIGSLATPGTYPITVMYCGDGPVGKAYVPGFNLQVMMAGIDGDFNHDNTVDAADYTVWRDGLGSTYTPDDYTLWKTHFGESAAASFTLLPSAVPEPATPALLAAGLLLISLWLARVRPRPAWP